MTLSKGHLSFALVKFYAFAILYVLIVMQIKLVVVVVVEGSQYQNILIYFKFLNFYVNGPVTYLLILLL